MSLSAGIPIESIAKLMGHASIASAQTYAQVTDNKISEDMDSLIRKYQKEEAIWTSIIIKQKETAVILIGVIICKSFAREMAIWDLCKSLFTPKIYYW